jgi:hypothetical protein
MVVAPLAVCLGANQPQPPGAVLPHCAVQVTPPGAMSLVTETFRGSCVVLTKVAGAGDAKVNIGVGGGACKIVVVENAGFADAVPAKDAVMVTMLPLGTVEGAV